ncbi:unnamed protein product [Prunus armeniaca]
MLGRSRCLTRMERLNWVSSPNLRLANASVRVFSARGTCQMVKVGNSFRSPWTLSRYWIILECVSMYSPEA